MTISPDAVQLLPDGSLRIDATATLSTIARNPLVRERHAVLALACEHPDRPGVGDLALAADLSQRGRCPWLQRGAACLKNGGTRCLALDGENRTLSILEGGPSWVLHPSDAGVALVALDATIQVAGPRGSFEVAASEFFLLPTGRLDREVALEDGESVVAVQLPAVSAGGVQLYEEVRDGDIVLVSLAATRRVDGDVRLVLGSVSPRPYRVYNSIEEETNTSGLDEDLIEGLAERALLDAEPLSENGFKFDIAARLLRDAIRALSAVS